MDLGMSLLTAKLKLFLEVFAGAEDNPRISCPSRQSIMDKQLCRKKNFSFMIKIRTMSVER